MVTFSSQRSEFKSAFSMIELVFAIVLISISMLSLPMLMTTNSSNQEDSLLQEGILLTSTKISQVLSFPWDPNSSPNPAIMSMSQVLDTAGDAELNRNGVTDFRFGHFPEELRRRMTPTAPNNRAASAIGAGANSISSQDGNVEDVNATAGSEQWAYKKPWRLATTVAYVSDIATYSDNVVNYDFPDPIAAPAPGTTNIKAVRVFATDLTPGSTSEGVALFSYSANIGEQEFYKRRY